MSNIIKVLLQYNLLLFLIANFLLVFKVEFIVLKTIRCNLEILKEGIEMINKFIKAGYIIALISFITSIGFRIDNNLEWSEAFLFIGGVLLLIASIVKILTKGK